MTEQEVKKIFGEPDKRLNVEVGRSTALLYNCRDKDIVQLGLDGRGLFVAATRVFDESKSVGFRVEYHQLDGAPPKQK